MKLRMAVSASLILATTGLLACGSDDAGSSATTSPAAPSSTSHPTSTSGPAPTAAAETEPTSPTTAAGSAGASGASASTVFPRGDIEAGLQPYVDDAVADLANRLNIDPSAIEVSSAVSVVWPDAALGCPVKGRQYAQVTEDGALIELSSDGRTHRYHAGGSTLPFLCDQPLARPPTTIG